MLYLSRRIQISSTKGLLFISGVRFGKCCILSLIAVLSPVHQLRFSGFRGSLHTVKYIAAFYALVTFIEAEGTVKFPVVYLVALL